MFNINYEPGRFYLIWSIFWSKKEDNLVQLNQGGNKVRNVWIHDYPKGKISNNLKSPTKRFKTKIKKNKSQTHV